MANRPPELSNVRILAAASAMTVTVVAWGVLVFAAIDFGRTARAGENNGWLYLVLSTVGAVACMFGAIVMAAQLHSLMRVPQHSSTRPLPQPLATLPALPEPDDLTHDDLTQWVPPARSPSTESVTSSVTQPTVPPSAQPAVPPTYAAYSGPTTTTYPSRSAGEPSTPDRPSQAGKRAAR